MTRAFTASDYTFSVNYSDDDACFVVHVLDLGLAAHGDTEAEALAEAVGVVEDVLEDLREDGEEPPVPWRRRPVHSTPRPSTVTASRGSIRV